MIIICTESFLFHICRNDVCSLKMLIKVYVETLFLEAGLFGPQPVELRAYTTLYSGITPGRTQGNI